MVLTKLVNRHLVLSSFLNPLANDESKSVLEVGLFEEKVLQLLAESLNFTYIDEFVLFTSQQLILNLCYTIQRPMDLSGPGILLNNSNRSMTSWNGCMGQIYRKEVDACVTFTQITETKQRRMVADFSQPIIWEDIGMITPAPHKLSRAFLVFNIFSFRIWAYLFLIATVVMLLLWLTYRTNNPKFNLSTWFLYIIASLSTGERSFFMGNLASRPSWMYRWMTSFWIFPISLGFIKIYTSMMLGMSAVANEQYLIKEIWELSSRPDIATYVYLGSLTDYSLLAQSGRFKVIGDELRKNPKLRLPPFNISKAIEAVTQPTNRNAIFLASRSVCQSIIDEDLERRDPSLPPRLVLSDEIFSLAGRQIIFQKNSHLTELFNQKIIQLREHGLIDYAAESTMLTGSKKLKKRLHAHNKRVKDGDQLQLGDLTGIFYIYFIGISAALLTFVVEITRHRQITNKNVNRVVALADINDNNSD